MLLTLMGLPLPTLRAPVPVKTADSVATTLSPAMRLASVPVTTALMLPS